MPPKLTERDLQIIIGGVAGGLKEAFPAPSEDDPALLPMEGSEDWRDLLADFERRYRSVKAEEE